MNFTVPADMWVNCGATKDFLKFVLLPWEYITGGYFSMILIALFVCFTYIKYHKMIYPLIVGILFLPITAGLFPHAFLINSFLIVGLLIGIFLHAMLNPGHFPKQRNLQCGENRNYEVPSSLKI